MEENKKMWEVSKLWLKLGSKVEICTVLCIEGFECAQIIIGRGLPVFLKQSNLSFSLSKKNQKKQDAKRDSEVFQGEVTCLSQPPG